MNRACRVGLTLLALTLLALLTPRGAAAESVFILHATDTGSVSQAARASADAGVRRALEAAGLLALDERDDPEGLARDLFECVNVRCVRGILGALGVDAALIVALWVDGESSTPVEVTVTLVDGSEREPNARFEIGDEGEISEASADASSEALSRWRGEWTLLVVEGAPLGAAVSINGEPVGTLPLRHAVRVGSVDLSVSRAGFQTLRLRERALESASGLHHVEVSLEATAGARRDRRWTAGPLTLGILGAGALALGAYGFARSGCDAEGGNGDCLLEDEMRALPVALLSSVGVMAIAASVAWVIVHRRRERETSVSLSPFQLRLTTRF